MQKKAWEIRYKHTAVYVSLSCYFLRRYERYWAARKPFFSSFFSHTTFCTAGMSDIGLRARRGKQCRSNAGTTIYVASYYYICVLILLCMCPHTTIYVSSYYYMCPHTTTYVSSYYNICVLILLYMCTRTNI
jgi:hypothetical protein